MAAAKLVTRCPACRTAFRLVADQLRLRQGLVRCGQCDTVFDAREHLIEVPAPAASAPVATDTPGVAPNAPAPGAAAGVTMAAALAHAEQTQQAAKAREHDAPFDPGYDPGYEVPALDSPTTMMSEAEGDAFAASRVVPDSTESASPDAERGQATHASEHAATEEASENPVAEPAPAGESTHAEVVEPSADISGGARIDAQSSETTDSQDASETTEAVESDANAEVADDAKAADATEASEAIEVPASAWHVEGSDAATVDASTPDDAQEVSEGPAPTHAASAEPAASESDGAQTEIESAQASAATNTVEMPEPETPLTAPPVPWPTLDHSAFDDEPPRQPGHSSLDPAAAFAPASPSGMPPSGAYSAKASWPPLKAAEASSTQPLPATGVTGVLETGESVAQSSDTLASTTAAKAEHAAGMSDADQPSADHDGDHDVNRAAASHPFSSSETVRSASGFLRAADPADPEAEAWAAQAKADADTDAVDPGVTSRDGTPDAVARETTTRHWLRRDATASPTTGPAFAPDFLRHTREREQARAPKKKLAAPGNSRMWLRTGVIVLALGAIVQGSYLARSQIAGSLPVLRPVLEAACAPFGCEVPPWRDLDALRIDSSQLQKQDEGSDVYQLAVTLRNQGRATTALPAIELVMTDLQDQLLLRRVLQPAEYLESTQRGFASTGLRAGSELPVRVRFRTQQSAANYRVLIFYP